MNWRPRVDRTVHLGRPTVATGGAEASSIQTSASPLDKLLGYFPAASLVLYSTADPVVRTLFSDSAEKIALWVTLFLAVLLNILLLQRVYKVKSRAQPFVSAVILVIYISALGGPLDLYDWWVPGIAALASIVAIGFLALVPGWVLVGQGN